MTRHYAVEISLTRPVSSAELHLASRRVPLAANSDRTRLMTVYNDKSSSRALHQLRRRLETSLPLDVLTTHYPDQDGHILLNVVLGRCADAEIRRAAAASGRCPRDVLGERITASLAQHQRQRRHRLKSQIQHLLTDHTPEEVVAYAASHLLRLPPG
ncbi:hypothetical protein ABZ313_19870 [Streptomyces sp. NPDC006251]|uniref:hypothetical protein n=1 Tax=Streptomyces sp. NPDC006251 TaxID=3155718 RepID=UPI0033A82834